MIAAELVSAKRLRNPPAVIVQPPPQTKQKKRPKQQLDEVFEDEDGIASSQTPATSGTALQKSASTSSRASDSSTGRKSGNGSSSEQTGNGYTPPKTKPNVSLSSAEKVKKGLPKTMYGSPNMYGITMPDPYNVPDGPEQKMISARVVEATNDITPRLHGPKPVPFLYWDTHQPTLCATQLINRFPDLILFADTHYHGVPQMAFRWATLIRTKANNERAAQIRTIKEVWVNSFSKYSIAYLYLPETTGSDEDEGNEGIHEVLAITETVRDSGIQGIEELRALLRSDAMYKNSAVFNLFCQGLESGVLKHSKRLPPTTISSLITIAHEAHFRLELWFTLSKVDFSHSSKVTHIAKRKEYFTAFCKLVKQDRIDNEAAAFAQRVASDELDGNIDGASEPLDSRYY